jgi:hypothetical protein
MSVRINFLAVPSSDGTTPRVVAPKIAVREERETTFVWTVRNEQVWRVPARWLLPAGRKVVSSQHGFFFTTDYS